MSDDEALGYVVRKILEGAQPLDKLGGHNVVFPVYLETGAMHMALNLDEVTMNRGHEDEVVKQKLASLATEIEYQKEETPAHE